MAIPQLVVFRLDEWRYALHLAAVERVVPAAEITLLPKAPAVVSGVINFQGRVLPVVNVRKRFKLREREIRPADRLIIAHTEVRSVILVVDAVDEVITRLPEEIAAPDEILPGMNYVEGIVKLEDGLILIHDLRKFLSLEEEQALEQAMAAT